MPKTLNPVNAFPTSIPNFPLAGNNEPVAIGPLEAAIQAILNRTENLHQSRLVVEGAGIKRIQRVSSLTALQNLAGMSDGDTVDVEGYGRYRLFNPSALTADGLWILTATGGGRWVHTAYLMRGINNGWAMLDSGGRLAQDVRDGSILTAHLANGAVTGPKLAAGAAVANIGYTPLNKAGDTMTGPLTVGGKTLQEIAFQPTSGVGWYRIIANANVFGGRLDIYAEWGAKVSRISLEGHNASYGNLGAFNAVQVFHYTSPLIAEVRWGNSGGTDAALDIYVADVGGRGSEPVILKFWGDAWHSIQSNPQYNPPVPTNSEKLSLTNRALVANRIEGAYNHQRRFAVSGNVGGQNGYTQPAFATVAQQEIPIQTNNRAIVLRRARFLLPNNFRLRISNQFLWTSSNNLNDVSPNFTLRNTDTSLSVVSIQLENLSGDPVQVVQSHAWWVEFELV